MVRYSWSSDERLCTASRDGLCKVWLISNRGNDICCCLLEFSPFNGTPCTAVDVFSSSVNDDVLVIALGSEDGDIAVWEVNAAVEGSCSARLIVTAAENVSHGAGVKRIQWNPRERSVDYGSRMLATCGEDHSIRVLNFEC